VWPLHSCKVPSRTLDTAESRPIRRPVVADNERALLPRKRAVFVVGESSWRLNDFCMAGFGMLSSAFACGVISTPEARHLGGSWKCHSRSFCGFNSAECRVLSKISRYAPPYDVDNLSTPNVDFSAFNNHNGRRGR